MEITYNIRYDDGTIISKTFNTEYVRFNEDRSVSFYHSLKILNLNPINNPNLLNDIIDQDKEITKIDIIVNGNVFYTTSNIITTFYKNGFSESGDLHEYILFTLR